MKIEINIKKILNECIPILGVLLFIGFSGLFFIDFIRFLVNLNNYQLDNEIILEIKNWGFIVSLVIVFNYLLFYRKKSNYAKYGFLFLFAFLLHNLNIFSLMDNLLILPESANELGIEAKLKLFHYQPYLSFTLLIIIAFIVFVFRLFKENIKVTLLQVLPIVFYFLLINVSFNIIDKTLLTKLMLHNVTIIDNAIKVNTIEIVCREEKFVCLDEQNKQLVYKNNDENLIEIQKYLFNNSYEKDTVININGEELLWLKRGSVFLVIKNVFYYEKENAKLLEQLLLGLFSLGAILIIWIKRAYK
jgi:hypothetical protein